MEAIFITARLKSTRLKRKILLKVNGIELINYQINRLKTMQGKKIILTTSTNAEDDPLVDIANKAGISCFRGSEEDVLERYLQACKTYAIDKFYVVYADEPFVDTDCLLKSIELMDKDRKMIILNDKLPVGTFGYGITYKAISYLVKEKKVKDTEVWGPLLNEYSLIEVIDNTSLLEGKYDHVRLTVDYFEDFEVFKKMISLIGDGYTRMRLDDIIKVYEDNELHRINGNRIREYNARIKNQGSIQDGH